MVRRGRRLCSGRGDGTRRRVPDVPTDLWRRLRADRGFTLIAGPCVIESEAQCLAIGRTLRRACQPLGITCVFKASFDKANRSSADSPRGPGLADGLAILGRVRKALGVPVTTDVHTEEQAAAAGRVVDVLQIPAFLCRQTDLIAAAVRTGRIVNLKKGQFLAPEDMEQVVRKAVAFGGGRLLVTERGTTFGYHHLVADMRAMPILRRLGFPVIFDATHSVQLPGAGGDRSGGQREFAPVLAASAVAAGANGVFIETHPDPDRAWSDGPNMIPLDQMPRLLKRLVRIREAAR
ncbi:MAG: 3-deoxy-8-phosphooctulonate synthase [Verrucomicrobiales bacterium]|nr:3-deoxy-8-phosphooctulonate synthase [Verrucomicrobiales bacterium]